MSDYIPVEVLVEILLRLPAKPLIRFGCVSKSWYSLIFSHDFISMYTNFTSTNLRHSNSSQLFIRYYSRTRGKEMFFMHADADQVDSYGGCQRFDCPIKNRSGGYLEIVGSCYGLVCLTDTGYQTEILRSMPRPILVWNPSAKKTMELPSKQHKSAQFLAFGFDFKTADFKVVSIHGWRRFPEDDFVVVGEVDIFALSEDSWRSITVTVPHPRSLIKYPLSRAYVNGNIHLIGHHEQDDVAAGMGSKSVVVVFDLGDEVFRELEMPSEVADGDSTDSLSIVKLRNSVSLVQYFKGDHQHRQSYSVCSIWVMHKYGMAESWTKDYTICLPGGVGRMLGFWRKNEILLVTSCGELVSFDPKNQKMDRLEIYGLPCSFHVDVYMESLVFTKHWFQFLTKLSTSTRAIQGGKNLYSSDKNRRAKRAKKGPWLIG